MNHLKLGLLVLISLYTTMASGIITRHDVADEAYRALAKKYPATCHFPDGEGTLVASKWVLTAAHIGEYIQQLVDLKENPKVLCNGKEYEIEKIILHPDYKPVIHDIALVKLKEAVKDVQPVRLFTSEATINELVTFVGRGDFGTGQTGPQKNG